MSWRVVGDLLSSGMPAWVGWDGGLFQGSSEALEDIDTFLQGHRLVGCSPVGPFLPADRSDEVAAFAIVTNVMRAIEAVAGETPELPSGDVPPGAVS